ncbi:MAG: hypothetical protein V3U19_10380 [Thermodesulfobacteriota bacterium]|jgi:hypothetical protein
MFKKLGFKILALMCILSISLILGTTSNVYSGAAVGGGCKVDPQFAKIIGPAIVGTVTFSVNEDDSDKTDIFFEGIERGQRVSWPGAWEISFDSITPEELRGFIIDRGDLPCLIVIAVQRFIIDVIDEDNPTKTADIVLLNLVP